MKIGFLFAGQGQQFLHMGQDLVANYVEARAIYDEAQSVLNYDVLALTQEQLDQTRFTQPALYTLCTAITKILDTKKIEATSVAGLSLGEYGALTYAQALSFNQGLHLIAKRAEIMQTALPSGTTSMAACLKTNRETVAQALAGTNLAICNVNTPSQIVIGGDRAELEAHIPLMKEQGIKMIVPLNVSTVSHMHLMSNASEKLREALEQVTFATPQCTFINNIHASNQTDGFVDTLARHISETTEMAATIHNMHDAGITHFIEIGPKGSLAKFVKEICGKETFVHTIYDMESLEALSL